jgi:hypothetical protein
VKELALLRTLAVHRFEQPSFDHFYLNIVFASQLFRRTDGNVLLCWSNRAIADCYFSHDLLPFMIKPPGSEALQA